jgi:hypothetical protein
MDGKRHFGKGTDKRNKFLMDFLERVTPDAEIGVGDTPLGFNRRRFNDKKARSGNGKMAVMHAVPVAGRPVHG